MKYYLYIIIIFYCHNCSMEKPILPNFLIWQLPSLYLLFCPSPIVATWIHVHIWYIHMSSQVFIRYKHHIYLRIYTFFWIINLDTFPLWFREWIMSNKKTRERRNTVSRVLLLCGFTRSSHTAIPIYTIPIKYFLYNEPIFYDSIYVICMM